MTDSAMTRVFLVDDHEIVRRGVADLVDSADDLSVTGQWGQFEGALQAIRQAAPDVAVLDVRLGDGSGIELCRDVRSELPDVACLMFTSFADDHALVDAGMAGAAGYALKQIRSNDLIESIRKVAQGAQLLDAAEVRMAMQRLRDSEEGKVDQLTDQESRIFELIGEGMSNRQIANTMFLAEKTVKNYVSNMFAKLGMSRRTEAAAYAARMDERRKQRFT